MLWNILEEEQNFTLDKHLNNNKSNQKSCLLAELNQKLLSKRIENSTSLDLRNTKGIHRKQKIVNGRM